MILCFLLVSAPQGASRWEMGFLPTEYMNDRQLIRGSVTCRRYWLLLLSRDERRSGERNLLPAVMSTE